MFSCRYHPRLRSLGSFSERYYELFVQDTLFCILESEQVDAGTHQFLVVRDPGDEVSQLVIVHHPRSDLVSFIFLHISNFQHKIYSDTDQLLCKLVGSPDKQEHPGEKFKSFGARVDASYSPKWDKIEDDGDYEDDNEGEPGEEGDAEVENVLDALEDMSEKAKLLLDLKGDVLHRLHLLLQTFLLSLLRLALTHPLLLLALIFLVQVLVPPTGDGKEENVSKKW